MTENFDEWQRFLKNFRVDGQNLPIEMMLAFLHIVKGEGHLNSQVIADNMIKSTKVERTYNAINKLVEKYGLIEKYKKEGDTHKAYLRLTSKGEETLTRLFEDDQKSHIDEMLIFLEKFLPDYSVLRNDHVLIFLHVADNEGKISIKDAKHFTGLSREKTRRYMYRLSTIHENSFGLLEEDDNVFRLTSKGNNLLKRL